MAGRDFVLLVVDDQNGVRRLLYEAFTDEGYRVRIAGGGVEALKMVVQEMPDMVLLDIKMPVMSGLETLAELRKSSKDLPVLMMTAYGDLEVVEQAKKLGVKHYIIKPFDLNEVKLIVKGLALEIRDRSGKLKEIG
ncbi:MAG: response regulator [Desulfocucumaceae bacterium]